jgi:multimeric flavodoxin WrbA
MIKIVGICGSPVKEGNVEIICNKALSHLKDREEVETEMISLADIQFGGCDHCNWCVNKQREDQFCVQEDDMRIIYPKILEADGILLATPVHFGRLSGLMANMIDRLRVFVHGKIYRGCLRNKVGGALAVGFRRGGGIETTLASLNSMFFVFQMIVATSQRYHLGAAAFASIEGKGSVKKGIRHMALEDDFGTESARLLADRILELATIVRAGEKALKI